MPEDFPPKEEQPSSFQEERGEERPQREEELLVLLEDERNRIRKRLSEKDEEKQRVLQELRRTYGDLPSDLPLENLQEEKRLLQEQLARIEREIQRLQGKTVPQGASGKERKQDKEEEWEREYKDASPWARAAFLEREGREEDIRVFFEEALQDFFAFVEQREGVFSEEKARDMWEEYVTSRIPREAQSTVFFQRFRKIVFQEQGASLERIYEFYKSRKHSSSV